MSNTQRLITRDWHPDGPGRGGTPATGPADVGDSSTGGDARSVLMTDGPGEELLVNGPSFVGPADHL
jgi:hypothetical protein